jgi:uncharacterized protein (TIGR00369 family)
MQWQPKDPKFKERTKSFLQGMPIASVFGFTFGEVSPGVVPLILPFNPSLTFDGKHFQASAVASLIDFAGGLAAYSLLPADWSLATLDVSMKLLAPAQGERLLGVGRALSAGQTISVANVEVFAQRDSLSSLCAVGMVSVRNFSAGPQKS